ncbi:MAG: AsmA-like C-terminal region-containing protein [Bacteroidota bacterium]|nr:AsmA-like C-terminal region-containing protein [Bacteroidota bacterium]
MKKTIVIIGVVILILLSTVIAIPIIFKGKIIETVKTEVNKNLNAIVDFDNDIKLNMIRSFPDFYLKVKDLKVVNKKPFEGDTLASIGSLSLRLDIWKAIKGNIGIKSFQLKNPNIYLHVLDDTVNFTANWDITIPSEEVEEEEESTDEESTFNLPVKSYKIVNANLTYNDELSEMFIETKGLTHEGSGDFSMEVFNLKTKTDIEKMTFKYEGIPFISKAKIMFKADLNIDLGKMKFTFKENKFLLNNLALNFDGFIAMPDENIEVDLSFDAPGTDFKDLISMIPAIYKTEFKQLTAKGKMNFNGWAKGVYNDEMMPAFEINLGVKNGMFKYPDLPAQVNNVNVDLNIKSPDANIDHMLINLKKFHAELGKEPIDASIFVKTVDSDPYIDAKIKGKIDLSQVKNYVELDEELKLSGIVNADVHVKGNSSAIENEQYSKFYAVGNVNINNIDYFSEEINKSVKIPVMQLAFSPEVVALKAFKMHINKNNLEAKGDLKNFIPYLFEKGTLQGNLNLSSSYFNLNNLLSSMPESDKENVGKENDTSSQSIETVELPENVELYMNASFSRLIYDEFDMKNANCNIILKDEELTIKNLSTNVFGGSMEVNGFYSSKLKNNPNVGFNLDLKNFNIKESFTNFEVIRKYVPIAKFIEGDFSGKLNFISTLKNNMEPEYNSIFSRGILSIDKMKVQEFRPLIILADALQMEEFKEMSVSNIHPSYKIENGKFYFTKPLKFSIDKTDFEVTGSNGIDKSIDYDIKIQMPAKKIKEQSGKLLKGLPHEELRQILLSEKVTIYAKMTGTIDNPKIKTSIKRMLADKKEDIKQKAKKELEKRKEEMEKQLKEEVDKKKKELEDKARKEAEKKKKELVEKTKKELEKKKKRLEEEAKKKLEEEAKKKLKGLFDK